MANPTAAATSRFGSRVEFLASITKVTSPGVSITRPFSFGMTLQPTGTMLETWTRLQCWIPASLSASSKDWSFSLCVPTPFVRKSCFGINAPAAG